MFKTLAALAAASFVMIPALVPAAHYVVPTTLNDLIAHLGSQASLGFVVDAGDAISMPTSTTQTLGTLPVGGSVAITRGNSAAVEATKDPVFVGKVGRQTASEFFRHDSVSGVSQMYFASGAGQTLFEQAHKNDAKFTFAGVFYIPSAAHGIGSYFYTDDTQLLTDVGIDLFYDVNDKLVLICNNGTGTVALDKRSTASVLFNQPVFIAYSYNETTGALVMQINGTQETLSGTYSSPSAAAATLFPLMPGGASGAVTASGKTFNMAYWSRALTASELLALYTQQKAKFGF